MPLPHDFEKTLTEKTDEQLYDMLAHDADATLFEKTLQKAVAKGILRGKLTAIIDSSPVHGAGAVADTYELIRGFVRRFIV